MGWANTWFGTNQNRLILGGNVNKLFGFDLATQKITDTVDTHQGCCVIKPSTKLLCVGHTLGQVSLRDPRTLQVEHNFEAHSGTVSDIEGNPACY
jgi:PAB-dependent poly(A)-specific ribonuclease subunit 2